MDCRRRHTACDFAIHFETVYIYLETIIKGVMFAVVLAARFRFAFDFREYKKLGMHVRVEGESIFGNRMGGAVGAGAAGGGVGNAGSGKVHSLEGMIASAADSGASLGQSPIWPARGPIRWRHEMQNPPSTSRAVDLGTTMPTIRPADLRTRTMTYSHPGDRRYGVELE